MPRGIITAMKPELARRWVREARVVARRPTQGVRPLPDFLIIGGQRCGTTSLWRWLGAHPDVVPGLAKEVQFFSSHWQRGEGWYRSHFPIRATRGRRAGRRAPLTFEATPYYLFHPQAAERAAGLVGSAKLLVLLRDPVARAWSHYRHVVRLGLEPLPFEEAIERELERLDGEIGRMQSDPGYQSHSHKVFSYLSRGVYADQLERWLRCFLREQLLVLGSEDLFATPARCFQQVLEFLELPNWTPDTFTAHTRSPKGGPSMPDATRRRLAAYFAPHNHRLEVLLGGRQFSWDG